MMFIFELLQKLKKIWILIINFILKLCFIFILFMNNNSCVRFPIFPLAIPFKLNLHLYIIPCLS